MRIRVVVADDERLFREGLRLLLESDPCFKVVGQAADGAEAIAMARRLRPDVLLLDLAIPQRPGVDALKAIASGPRPVRTLVVTRAVTRADLVTALQYGARGVVLKDVAPEMLFKSIRAVMNGQYWIGREAVSDLVAAVRESRPLAVQQRPSRPFNLTARELEIVRGVLNGYANKEIASQLRVTEDTVKHHLTSIFDKTGVSSRLELALFATHHRLA